MIFYLGTHHADWLGKTSVALFVSRRVLAKRKRLPVSSAPWALDSGGFTELFLHDRYEVSPGQYAEEALRFQAEIGNMQWAAIQDWMCEPFMCAKTKMSVEEHQALTIQSWFTMTAKAPEVPWAPVLQGYRIDDYFRHLEGYKAAGVDLRQQPIVGVGSVCRRQGTGIAEDLIRALAADGVRLHAFGFKLTGLERVGRYLASSDSMAWSRQARWNKPLPGCTHKSCANCFRYALAWRERAVNAANKSHSRLI